MQIEMAAIKDLSIFICSEQPESWRAFATRTEFDVRVGGLQVHQCLRCANRYVVEFEE